MSDELVNYIIGQIGQGYRVDQIENYLKNYGYDQEEIKKSTEVAVDLSSKSYIGYIDQQIQAGFRLPQIRAGLVNQGYDYRIIDAAMNHYHSNLFSGIKDKFDNYLRAENEKKQLSIAVNSSVRQGLNYGLTLENIQSNLISQGYNPNIVSAEINKFRQSQLHIPKAAIIPVISIFVIVVAVYFFMGSSAPAQEMQERLLDVTARNSQPDMSLYPGSYLHFHVERIPMGTEREFDVDFEYRIFDREDNLIRRASTTKSIVSNLGDKIKLPNSMEPGVYKFEVIAEYMGETQAKSSFEFDVLDDSDLDEGDTEQDPDDILDDIDEPSDDINETENISDDIDEPTEVPIEEPIDEADEEPPVDMPEEEILEDVFVDISSGRRLSTGDVNRVKYALESDGPDYALFLCNKIRDTALSDECKLVVAQETGNIEFCENTKTDSGHDKCYLEFAQNSTNDEICDNMIGRSSTTVCKIYVVRNKNLAIMEEQDQDEYFNKIKESYD